MNKTLVSLLGAAALGMVPLAASAVTYTFNASLNGANEVGSSSSTATGLASLIYDTHDTADLTDDTYDFTMAVFGLSGGTAAGTAASGYHIHGAATTTENAPVRVALDGAPFVSLNMGSTLLVGGDDVPVTMIPETPAGASNAGHPAMSFLDMLQGQLAYVNVHTAADPGGAVRGQLVGVTPVPEPSTYALALAGLGVVGAAAWRRRRELR